MQALSTPDHADVGARAVFARLLGMYALLLYPILHADRPYNDDLKRALLGRASWDSNGRPLATLLMRALQCYNHAMVDIAPLPQIGAIVVLAWTGARLARRFTDASPWLAALLVLPEIQPRVLVGLGALLASGLLVLRMALRTRALRTRAWRDRVCVTVAGMFALGMWVIASAYGNAMTDQQHYEQHIAGRLADDLATLSAAQPIHRLVVAGSAGFSPLAAHVAGEFPLMRRLVPTYLDADDRFSTSGLLMFYLPQWVDARRPLLNQPLPGDALLAARCAGVPDRITAGYRLCAQGGIAWVQFQPTALPSADELR